MYRDRNWWLYVFPNEVENVLSAQPSVAQVTVIGVPDDHWGESVKVVAVLRPGVEKNDALTEGLINSVKEPKACAGTKVYRLCGNTPVNSGWQA